MMRKNKHFRFRKFSAVMAAVLLLTAGSASCGVLAAETAAEEVTVETAESGETKNAEGDVMQYRWFAPEEEKDGESYPLVVFLHGSDAAGTDNEVQLTATQGPLFLANHSREAGDPMFVLAPQCSFENWTDPKAEELLKQTIDEFAEAHPVDTNRIYLQGMDIGATGVWDMILTYPDYFAAAIPMCGAVPEKFYDNNGYEAITDLPIWAYHVADDDVVPVEETQKAIDTLTENGSTVVKFEPFTAGSVTPSHEVWNVVYSIGTPYNWMIIQTRENYEKSEDVSLVYTSNKLKDDVTEVIDFKQDKIYVVDKGDEALIVDSGMAGMGTADLYGYIRDNVLTNPDAKLDILLTHNHGDHIIGVPSLLGSGKVDKIYIHPDDKDGFVETMKKFEVPEDSLNIVDINDGDTVTIWDKELQILHVPGHTPGSIVAFYDDYIFTGDTVGSGDLWIFSKEIMDGLSVHIDHFNDAIKESGKEYELLTGHNENLRPFTNKYVEEMSELIHQYDNGTVDVGIYTRKNGNYIGNGDAHIFYLLEMPQQK